MSDSRNTPKSSAPDAAGNEANDATKIKRYVEKAIDNTIKSVIKDDISRAYQNVNFPIELNQTVDTLIQLITTNTTGMKEDALKENLSESSDLCLLLNSSFTPADKQTDEAK